MEGARGAVRALLSGGERPGASGPLTSPWAYEPLRVARESSPCRRARCAGARAALPGRESRRRPPSPRAAPSLLDLCVTIVLVWD